jgi:hypothetical protein
MRHGSIRNHISCFRGWCLADRCSASGSLVLGWHIMLMCGVLSYGGWVIRHSLATFEAVAFFTLILLYICFECCSIHTCTASWNLFIAGSRYMGAGFLALERVACSRLFNVVLGSSSCAECPLDGLISQVIVTASHMERLTCRLYFCSSEICRVLEKPL